MEELAASVRGVLSAASDSGLLPHIADDTTDPPPIDSEHKVPGVAQRRSEARAILDVATAVDRVIPIETDSWAAAQAWTQLGNALYEYGDADGAIRAYSTALRPHGSSVGPKSPLDSASLLRARGNLARALASERHYSRSEWHLRFCVFKEGHDASVEAPTRQSVFERLRLSSQNETPPHNDPSSDHLRHRPTDASEFTYAVTRRAERLMHGGHYQEALVALNEARYAMEVLLGVEEKNPSPIPDNAFRSAQSERGEARRIASRFRSTDDRFGPFNAEAWALNFLGKCYKLSWQIAVVIGHTDPEYYRKRAERYLREASVHDPFLLYPYGHRVEIIRDRSLPQQDKVALHRVLYDQVERLSQRGATGNLVASRLRERHPELQVSSMARSERG